MVLFDFGVGGILPFLGAYLIVTGLNYGYQSGFSPGAGFMSFWLGVILLILGLFLFVESLIKLKSQRKAAAMGSVAGKEPAGKTAGDGFCWGSLRKILLLMCGLCVVNLLIEWLGFIFSVCLMSLVMMMVMNRRPWLMNVSIAVCTGLVLHFGFRVFFELTMPTGLLPF
jgi:hypothetical protein